jgi:hypothetical protein
VALYRLAIARTAASKKMVWLLDLSEPNATADGGLTGSDPIAFFTALQIISREKGFSRKSNIRNFSAARGFRMPGLRAPSSGPLAECFRNRRSIGLSNIRSNFPRLSSVKKTGVQGVPWPYTNGAFPASVHPILAGRYKIYNTTDLVSLRHMIALDQTVRVRGHC